MQLDAQAVERENRRFAFRVALLRRRGIEPTRAGELAAVLCLRDADRDDRRMCLECHELQNSRQCGAVRRKAHGTAGRALEPITDMLHRCGNFRWSTPA